VVAAEFGDVKIIKVTTAITTAAIAIIKN